MFLGMGIGMLFDHAGAGVIIGMGVGFLLDSLMKEEAESKLSLSLPGTVKKASVAALGLFFIALGLAMLYDWSIVWPYGVAAFIIALGLIFLVLGTKGEEK